MKLTKKPEVSITSGSKVINLFKRIEKKKMRYISGAHCMLYLSVSKLKSPKIKISFPDSVISASKLFKVSRKSKIGFFPREKYVCC